MTKALLSRFPHLKKCHQRDEDAQAVWHRSIKRHFKRHRQRNCENIPSIINHRLVYQRRKAGNGEASLAKKSRASIAWGVKNYLPKRLEGEDDISIESHVNRMIDMSRLHKDRRQKHIIDMLMEKTFPERRRMLVEELVKVPEMKLKYPLLFTEDEVRNDKAILFS